MGANLHMKLTLIFIGVKPFMRKLNKNLYRKMHPKFNGYRTPTILPSI